MTKYFDLLRAHQQNKQDRASTDTVEVTETTSSATAHNPYAQKEVAENNSLLEPELTSELIDEAEYDDETNQQPSNNEISIDSLPTEETSTQPSAQVESHKNTAINSSGFSVAAWLQDISLSLQTVFQAAEKHQDTNLAILDGVLQNLLEQLEDNTKVLDALELEISRNIKQICNADCTVNDLVEKSIMMMLYTIKISLRLKLQHQTIVEHAVAAMLHHIGMAMVPSEVRYKVGKLTKDELALIRKAPENAIEYLKSCHVPHENILLAAEQAAERYDGSGPRGLSGHDIAWIARVVGLLSMFEALIHIRPYRPRLLPRDAIRELVNHHKKAFDPVLLKALIEAVSLYPVGTFVQLNTGEIGQVTMVHSKFPLRPVVYINMDKHGNPITAREIDLKQQPNLMIQKCMYEESLKSDDA